MTNTSTFITANKNTNNCGKINMSFKRKVATNYYCVWRERERELLVPAVNDSYKFTLHKVSRVTTGHLPSRERPVDY